MINPLSQAKYNELQILVYSAYNQNSLKEGKRDFHPWMVGARVWRAGDLSSVTLGS